MAKRFRVKIVHHDGADSSVLVRYARTDGTLSQGTLLANDIYDFSDFPMDREVFVHIDRNNAVRLTTLLDLRKTRDQCFIWGRPRIMTLRVVKDELTLKVDLYTPQEVILCSGSHVEGGARRPVFANFGLRRIGKMFEGPANLSAGIVHTNPSCVYTFFEFSGPNSKFHHLLYGRGVGNLPGAGSPRTVVSMGTFEFPLQRAFLSANDFYAYLAQTGRLRPGTLMAIEFLSHAAPQGPVMENTFRQSPADVMTAERQRDLFDHICVPECPSHIGHGAHLYRMPVHFQNLVYEITDTGARLSAKEAIRYSIRHSIQPSEGAPHLSRASYRVRGGHFNEVYEEDIDFRHTDFLMFGDENLANMQRAPHVDCIIRVWGCAWGDEGPRLSAFSNSMHPNWLNGPNNELITVNSSYSPHLTSGAHPTLNQHWQIRRGDAKLIFLSACRRTYAQSIATALNRPCYAAIPGTSADMQPSTPRLNALLVNPTQAARIRRLAQEMIPDDYQHRDEAEYARFIGTPARRDHTLSVLVTGFAPFPPRSTNASTDAVNGLTQAAVRALIDVPPWINLTLQFNTMTNVDVVWTCPGPVVQPRQNPRANAPPIRGARGILDRLRQMPGGGPDIVLIVGESGIMSSRLATIRLECCARNVGAVQDVPFNHDNDGNLLAAPGELFPGDPYYLVTSVPRSVWGAAASRIMAHGIGVSTPSLNLQGNPARMFNGTEEYNPPGSFICNETYYHLLREAYFGDTGRPASGRWVLLAHVGAYSDQLTIQLLTRALTATLASLCEDMLWATEFHGKVADVANPESILRSRTPNGRGPNDTN